MNQCLAEQFCQRGPRSHVNTEGLLNFTRRHDIGAVKTLVGSTESEAGSADFS